MRNITEIEEIREELRKSELLKGNNSTSGLAAARTLAVANIFIGVAGFIGPWISGNRQKNLNTRSGFLFDTFAMNPPHALLHLGMGLAGLRAWNKEKRASRYLRLHAGIFGALSLAGLAKAKEGGEVHRFMGIAINPPASAVHVLWTGMGLAFSGKDGKK